jgi:hypothetical protein
LLLRNTGNKLPVPPATGIIIGVGVGIEIEGKKMEFGHERPDAGNARKALLNRIVAMLTKLW